MNELIRNEYLMKSVEHIMWRNEYSWTCIEEENEEKNEEEDDDEEKKNSAAEIRFLSFWPGRNIIYVLNYERDEGDKARENPTFRRTAQFIGEARNKKVIETQGTYDRR